MRVVTFEVCNFHIKGDLFYVFICMFYQTTEQENSSFCDSSRSV